MYKLRNYPLIQQLSDYDCGVAVTQAVLLYFDKHKGYKELEVDLKTTKEDGTPPENIISVLEGHGLKYKEGSITDIQENILRNNPSIILVKIKDETHYNSVIGFDENKFILHDPLNKKEKKLTYKTFLKKWDDEYAIIIEKWEAQEIQ